MAAATFDGPNLLVILPSPVAGVLAIDVQQDIYSDWKVWVKDMGGHAYEPAFDTTGGDPLPGGQFISGVYFLRNDLGWRIIASDEDQDVTLIGDLFPRDGDLPMFDSRPTRTITYAITRSTSPRDITQPEILRLARLIPGSL